MKKNKQELVQLGVVMVVLVALLIPLGMFLYWEWVPRTTTITVQETKWSMWMTSKGSLPLVQEADNWVKDTQGTWYENSVNFKRWNYQVDNFQPGTTYTMKVYGINNPSLGFYPMISEIVSE